MAEALRRQGVNVTLFDTWSTSLGDVDVLCYSSYGSELFPELRRHVACLASSRVGRAASALCLASRAAATPGRNP